MGASYLASGEGSKWSEAWFSKGLRDAARHGGMLKPIAMSTQISSNHAYISPEHEYKPVLDRHAFHPGPNGTGAKAIIRKPMNSDSESIDT
jgi:hypothetical protein